MTADDRAADERAPLLSRRSQTAHARQYGDNNAAPHQHRTRDSDDDGTNHSGDDQHEDGAHENVEIIDFSPDDPENPRNWSVARKRLNVLVVALMALLSPLASSCFTPGIAEIARDLNTSVTAVVGATSGYVVCLGIAPLILAPLSETFGRRPLYIICFTVFTLLQIPCALAPNVTFLNTARTLAGAFGSVGPANGAGTLNDMFDPRERAGFYGWYLLGPLLGPTIGPILGGLVFQHLHWRWLFWILTMICAVNTLAGFFLLRESYAPAILSKRKRALTVAQQQDHAPRSSSNGRATPGKPRQKTLRIKDQDDRPFRVRLRDRMITPLRILFTQPVVMTVGLYQAILFGTTYSLWTNFEAIYHDRYGFKSWQVGLTYLSPGLGFLLAVRLVVPRIDTVYNALAMRNARRHRDDEEEQQQGHRHDEHGDEDLKPMPKPEYRLPLANIGSVFIPLSLFWFAWSVELRAPWPVSLLATVFFGVGQTSVMNTVSNYFIDSFDKYAASAIAAGSVFRSVVGGILPLFAPSLFEAVGYGWGISVSAFITLALAPAPLVFMRYGEWLRERFAIEL